MVRESDLVLVAVTPLVAETVFAGLGAALADGRERCFVSLVSGWSRQRIIKVTHLYPDSVPAGDHKDSAPHWIPPNNAFATWI